MRSCHGQNVDLLRIFKRCKKGLCIGRRDICVELSAIVGRKIKLEKLHKRLEDCYLLRMAAFADIVDRYIDIYLKKSINWLKIYALIIIILNDGSLTPGELGRKMLRPKDSITKLVSVLVKDGLVILNG